MVDTTKRTHTTNVNKTCTVLQITRRLRRTGKCGNRKGHHNTEPSFKSTLSPADRTHYKGQSTDKHNINEVS